MASAIAIPRDEPNYDSSCSSITVPDSTRSWMSNLSFSSRRHRSSSSVSVCSTATAATDISHGTNKPHKANHVAWEAIRRLKLNKGPVGLDDFRLVRRLGSGDMGNVYLCQIRKPIVEMPQCSYAMKVVDREAVAMRNKLKRAEMEKEILGMIDHPFLPTLYAEFEASHYSCLLMEFCPGGDLHAARLRQPGRRFSIPSAKFYAAETLVALEYLHMMGIVYRDLKPENVLVREDGHIMLSDFDLCLKSDVVPKLLRTKARSRSSEGRFKTISTTATTKTSTPSCASSPIQPVLSCFSGSGKTKQATCTRQQTNMVVVEPTNARSKSFVGTHEYLAPEVISGQGHGSEVDWWTLGVFLYELLYGMTPFKGETNEKTLRNIVKQPLRFPRVREREESERKREREREKVEDLIRKLLAKNPKKRMGSCMGAVEIKRHDFFKGVNWALIRSVRPPEVPKDLNINIRSSSNSSRVLVPKLSKKLRDEPYQITTAHHHFDYF